MEEKVIIKEEYFHYKADSGQKRPYVYTICTLLDNNNNKLLAFGISICSWRDQYDRKKGNRIAKNRAYIAYDEKKNSSIIRKDLADIIAFYNLPAYKSVYMGF